MESVWCSSFQLLYLKGRHKIWLIYRISFLSSVWNFLKITFIGIFHRDQKINVSEYFASFGRRCADYSMPEKNSLLEVFFCTRGMESDSVYKCVCVKERERNLVSNLLYDKGRYTKEEKHQKSFFLLFSQTTQCAHTSRSSNSCL